MVDWQIGVLLPHSPKYLSTIQLPVTFDPGARCPNTEKFWREVLPADCIPTVEELFGVAMTTTTKYETAFMFTGSGANGKGTLINQLTAFIGKQNVSNVPLQELGEHRFKRAELFGKLLNIFADLDKRALQSTGYFKMITSGDEIDAERKHKDPFFFRPFTKLVFSANELPRTSDQTHAFFRRWIIIPFEKRFSRGQNADVRLIEKITTDKELSGVLNRALDGLRRLHATDTFTQPQATRDALEAYKLANDSTAAFVKECCIIDAAAKVGRTKLYYAYKNWCADGNMRPLSNRKFYARLLELYPHIVKARPGGGERLFYGIDVGNY
jgi:putative DNA primase/helicase